METEVDACPPRCEAWTGGVFAPPHFVKVNYRDSRLGGEGGRHDNSDIRLCAVCRREHWLRSCWCAPRRAIACWPRYAKAGWVVTA